MLLKLRKNLCCDANKPNVTACTWNILDSSLLCCFNLKISRCTVSLLLLIDGKSPEYFGFRFSVHVDICWETFTVYKEFSSVLSYLKQIIIFVFVLQLPTRIRVVVHTTCHYTVNVLCISWSTGSTKVSRTWCNFLTMGSYKKCPRQDCWDVHSTWVVIIVKYLRSWCDAAVISCLSHKFMPPIWRKYSCLCGCSDCSIHTMYT